MNKKRTYKAYSLLDLTRASAAVRDGKSYRKACSEFDVKNGHCMIS